MNTFVKNNNLLISDKYQRTVVEYQSGIAAAAGVGGAADPTTQNWTYQGASSGYSDSYDSGDGGWRIVDATTFNPSLFFIQTLSTDQIYDLINKDWSIHYNVALDKDAIQRDGTSVVDYYLAPNNSRQNNMSIIIRVAGYFHYHITWYLDASNQILIGNNNNISERYNTGYYLGGINPVPQFLNGSAIYNKSTNTLQLYLDNNYLGDVSLSSSTAENRVYIGASSSSGQGSAIWNSFALKSY